MYNGIGGKIDAVRKIEDEAYKAGATNCYFMP